MAIEAVLFDIDGTLVDSNDFHVLAWEEAFAGIGAHFDRRRVHDEIGKGTDNLVPALLPHLDAAAVEALGEAHGRSFKTRFLDEVRPFPSAHELLARVHAAGMTVVLASSASQAEIDHYLDLLDARALVGATTSADDVARTKPAPDIFATALARIAPVRTDRTLVIGDTPYDMDAARKCGIAPIGLRSGGFADPSLKHAGAIALYDDAAALLAHYTDSPLAD